MMNFFKRIAGKGEDNTAIKLTKEQEAIIRSKGNIKINAVAGSGKTTTIIEYARTRPADSRILYLAFNRTVKLEAEKKFAAQGLANVKVETAHSLAYKKVVFQHNYQVRAQGYKTHEIVDLLRLKGTGEKHTEYILANHINKFTAYFCNSDKLKVQDLNYLRTVTDEGAKDFVENHYALIERGTRLLLSKMDRGEVEITHDFYLKKFQLQQPVLPYDYILFDEGQDASAAMLDIFLKQKATKVIVGDTHQQIYSWRYAINSLEKTSFKSFDLSTSFRFNQDIADLAIKVLDWKRFFQESKSVCLIGNGHHTERKVKAIIARTNLGLLLKAIDYITTHKQVKHIYFEGNIHSYTYADEGTSLYDVLSLHNGNMDSIRDKLVRSMNSLDELEEYIEKTEDVQLAMMVEIVKEYGSSIHNILKSLKEKHTGDKEKEKAEVIFSTVHRCKGMEYDTVELVNDFVTEAKLERLSKDNKKPEELNIPKWHEEINLLYVAITRTRSTIKIPETLLPTGFPPSSFIHPQEVKKDGEKLDATSPARVSYSDKSSNHGKTYSHTEVRTRLKEEAHQSWTAIDDKRLKELFEDGVHIMDIAKRLGRKTSLVLSRLKKLGLLTTHKY